MLKITLTALVAICAVLPGRLSATSITQLNSQTICVNVNQSESNAFPRLVNLVQAETDPALVEAIFKKAALKYDLELAKLINQYQNGEIMVEKNVNGYAVVETKSGGTIIAIIDEF